MELHEKIKTMRELKQWSQESMAEKLGMSATGYAKIEQGKTRLSVDRLEKIAEILEGCSYVNDCVETGTVPPREASRKSDSICRFCSYKDECWVV